MNGFWIFLLILFALFHTHPNGPAEIKEICLQLGGTAVEQPKGVFQKCLLETAPK